MPSILPTPDILVGAFAQRRSPSNSTQGEAEPRLVPKERPLFPAWSAVDDVKNTAQSVEKGVADEWNKASNKVQAKTGQIEMYSGKYYATCTFGGLMACVNINYAP